MINSKLKKLYFSLIVAIPISILLNFAGGYIFQNHIMLLTQTLLTILILYIVPQYWYKGIIKTKSVYFIAPASIISIMFLARFGVVVFNQMPSIGFWAGIGSIIRLEFWFFVFLLILLVMQKVKSDKLKYIDKILFGITILASLDSWRLLEKLIFEPTQPLTNWSYFLVPLIVIGFPTLFFILFNRFNKEN